MTVIFGQRRSPAAMLCREMNAPHRHAVKKGLRAIRGDREQIKLPPSWQNLPLTEVLQV